MKVSMIVAMSENRVIGKENQLPWHLSGDLKRFKKITHGHPVVMGRKTFESIGRLLPGRKNIIITRQAHYQPPVQNDLKPGTSYRIAGSVEEALAPFKDKTEEVFILGGGDVFAQCMGFADKLYLTLVHKHVEGDVYFPEVPEGRFREVSRESVSGDAMPYSFVDYERV